MGDDKSVKARDNLGIIITGDDNIFYHSPKPQTLQEAIIEWQSQTKIPLNSNLTLESRDEQVAQLINLLSQSPSKIIVVSPRSKEESYAFIINTLDSNEECATKVRVIKSQEAWDSTVNSNKSLILVYQGFTPSNIGVAITQEHFVVEAEERLNLIDKSHEVIELPNIRKSHQIDTLQEMGLNSNDAWRVYDDTKGFLYMIAQHPLLQPMERVIPNWVCSYDIEILSTILFINSWNRTNQTDTQIIEQLAGMSYEALEKELYKLKNEEKAPIRLIGNVWQVISKINLWDLIADKISLSQIEKLNPIILEVFSEIDPAYELDPSKRSYAYIYEKVMKYSGSIRENLADTLALFSTFGENRVPHLSGVNNLIDNWLEKLFENNLNVEAWYSYHHPLLLLAEASPNSFLTALEKSLDNISTTRIEELFLDAGGMGSCFHCNLLWALEDVSWNLDYLPRVVLVLARLSKLEIKSNMGNQPFNSLRDIFLGWVPHSSATHQEKIQILEHILLKKYPNTTWKLLTELLPSYHMSTSPINSPKYQDWNETLSDVILDKNHDEYCQEINRLLFNNVNEDVKYWFSIFDNIEKFYQKYFFKILDKFMGLDKNIFDDETRLLLATTLREKIHHHRSHPHSNWAIPKEFVNKIEEAFLFIEPVNIIDKYWYLFDGRVHLLNPIPYEPNDDSYKKENKIVSKLRNEAMKEIIKEESFQEIVKLIKKVDFSGTIGREIFLLTGDKDYEVMLKWIEGKDKNLLSCARTYMQNYISSKPFKTSSLEGLSNTQKAEIILILSFNMDNLEILKKQHVEVQKYYWKNLNQFHLFGKTESDSFAWVVSQLYQYGSVTQLLEFIRHNLKDIESGQLNIDAEFLYSILDELNPNQEKYRYHDVSEIIEFLQASNIEKHKKHLMEWKYLGLDNFSPTYWEKEIIQDATVFVHLVSLVYKSKKPREESVELTEEQIVSVAKNATLMLENISLFSEYSDINSLTVDSLRNWVILAREAFRKVDRVDIGDKQIGKLLAETPKGKDNIFPNEITREVLEEFLNDNIQTAFIVAIQNQRGIFTKAHDEGGSQEHQLSDKYKNHADKLKFTHPKVSKTLKDLCDIYLDQAKREDLRNEF